MGGVDINWKIELSNFFFRLMFPKQWEHMGHLIDDIIRLERGNIKYTTTSDANTKSEIFPKYDDAGIK